MAIFGSCKTLGICGCEKSLSITIPLTKQVSYNRPPTLPYTLMRSMLTSRRSISATDNTASTQICASLSRSRLTTLELSVDRAVCNRYSCVSSGMVSAIYSNRLQAISHAFSKPYEMRELWMPLSRSAEACSRSAPAKHTTPVVPSPISESCDLLNYTIS